MTKGIYNIVNIITRDFYVGSSWSNSGIEGRNKKELRELRTDNWLCKDGRRTHIQNAWNLYGEQAFSWVVVEALPDDWDNKQIHAVEQQHLDFFWHSGVLYNMKSIASGGAAPSTPEIRNKRSLSMKIANAKPEVREKRRLTKQKPEVKEQRRLTDLKPEVKARRSAAMKEVMSRPDVKKKLSGENSANAKLTWSQVIDIREQYIHGKTHDMLAKLYNISPSTTKQIVHYKTWKID